MKDMIQIPVELALGLSDELRSFLSKTEESSSGWDYERCSFCGESKLLDNENAYNTLTHRDDCIGIKLEKLLDEQLEPYRDAKRTEEYERGLRLIRYKAAQIKESLDFERFAKKLDMLIFRMDCVGAVWPSNSARSLREDFQKSQDAFCDRIASQLDMFQAMRKMKSPAGKADAIFAAELLLDLQECGCPLEFDLSEFEKAELAKLEDRE